MFFVIQSGERRRLPHASDIEWLTRFLQNRNQFRTSNSIADAHTREPVNLRKSSQDNNVSALAHITKGIRRVLQKFVIRFVENGDDVFRNASHEPIDLALIDQGAGRIVWIGDKNQTGPGCDRLEKGVEMMSVIRARNLDRPGGE